MVSSIHLTYFRLVLSDVQICTEITLRVLWDVNNLKVVIASLRNLDVLSPRTQLRNAIYVRSCIQENHAVPQLDVWSPAHEVDDGTTL